MRMLRPVVTLLLAFVVVAPPAPAAAQSVPGVTATEIKIGALGALTGPGYLYGRLIMNGAEVVYNEVNNAGGIHGRKIVLVREDDRCDAASAIAAAKKLIFQHQVFMLHGGGCSNASIAARPEVDGISHTSAPSRSTGCRPQSLAIRTPGKHAPKPRVAVKHTARGRAYAIRARSAGTAARSSAEVTSALSVATRLTTSVKPMPCRSSSRSLSQSTAPGTSSLFDSSRQKALPGCA